MAKHLDFELIKPTKEFLYSGDFWRRLKVGRKSERSYLKKLVSLSKKDKTNIVMLIKNNEIAGLIALSAFRIDDLPCVQVDYLFVSAPYRKQTFLELDNIKISQYLINYAIQSSTQIKETVAIKFLLLLPADDNLVKTYDEMDFKPLHSKTKWMVFKLA